MLIVDDDTIVRMLLQDICEASGWEGVAAATADDAILAAGLQHIDLIFLDLQLGDTDGDPLDNLRALRAIRPATPIFVVTGQSPELVADGIIQAGGQGVIGKPCPVPEIAALLRCYRPTVAVPTVSR